MSVLFFLPRIDALQRAIKNSTYSEEQRVNMMDFLQQKAKFLEHGELRDNQFERLAELGYGNGGVVLKVRHQLSGTIMARKVELIVLMYVCLPFVLFAFPTILALVIRFRI